MKIIALRGSDSCGKTETLNLVYDSILLRTTFVRGKIQLGGDSRDFEDEVTLTDGRKVAFYTMGDYSIHTIEAIKKYDVLGFDLLICASNVKFKRPIQKIMLYPHDLVIKTIAPTLSKTDTDIANNTDATIILGLI